MSIRSKYTMYCDATAVPTAGQWVPFNLEASPFNVSVAVVVGSAGGADYRVEHTFDHVMKGETAVAFVHTDLSANNTNNDGNYAYPIMAARLVVVSAASAQHVHAYFTQSGNE